MFRMKLYITIFGLGAMLMLSACEKTVTLDLKQTPSRVVIEGMLTDDVAYQYVKVSRTADFYSSAQSPRIADATVQVQDDAGHLYNFVHNPRSHADSAGYYLPETPFAGEVGRTYTLTVVVEGVSYTATDKLLRIVNIDKLEVKVDDDEKADPKDEGRFYQLLLFVKEPQDTRDYYMFKCIRNGKVEYANNTDIYYADDELVGEDIDGIPLPVYYAQGDEAGVEVYSLSRDAFVFYRDLQKLLNNDGGLFGTPPADPRTNLSNGALGFFQVSALVKGSMKVE